MLIESDVVPFQCSNPPLGSSLIFSPHADDETFGVGGTILRMTDNKQPVDVVLMTDGSEAGSTTERNREFSSTCDSLGVRKRVLLAIKDRSLTVDDATVALLVSILEEAKADNIFFPSPFEYHVDHRATAWLVWAALRKIKFDGNAFSYEIGNQSPTNTLIDISPVMGRKLTLMQSYRSQLSYNNYPDKIEAMNRARSYTLPSDVSYAEAFFRFDSVEDDLVVPLYRHLASFQQGLSVVSMPTVSVMIRTKDRPVPLTRALNSLARQTYPYIEVNCFNDGGDAVDEIFDGFSFPRVNIVNNRESIGRAAAANALLEMASGEFCIFLDDDDEFDPNHIETLVSAARRNPNVKAVYSGVRVGGSAKLETYNYSYDPALLRYGNFIPIHAVLFSRKLIDSCRFDESLPMYEDWDFWLQVSQVTSMLHVDAITATYHIHGNSGAGHSGIKTEERKWKLRIYEKWLSKCSPEQFEQTFKVIEQNSNIVIEKESKHDSYRQGIECSRGERVGGEFNGGKSGALHEKWEREHKVSLLDWMVHSHDDSRETERKFTLKSASGRSEQCRALFQEVFEQPMPNRFWDWKYTATEYRNVCAVNEDGVVVGFYGATLREVLIFGEKQNALQPCDTMVAARARGGRGQANTFFAMYKVWQNMNLFPGSEIRMVFGFPNARVYKLASSLGLYDQIDQVMAITWKASDSDKPLANKERKKVGFRRLRDCFRSVVGHSIGGSSKVCGHQGTFEQISVRPVTLDDSRRVDAIWADMTKSFCDSALGGRDFEYLRYRYVEHPVCEYQIYIASDGDSSAVFVLKVEANGIKLMDIVAAKDSVALGIHGAVKKARELNSDLTAWITASHHYLFKGVCGAISTETEIPIAVGACIPEQERIRQRDSWFLMYGDTDFI